MDNINIIKNKNLQQKYSNYDYINNKNNYYSNLDKDKINANKQKNKKRQPWDNTKKLVFQLTSDKTKVEYISPSISKSRSKSRSLSKSRSKSLSNNGNYSDENSENNQSNSSYEEELKKAKKEYKEKFLKNNKITDPDYIPGKRLYENYQKKIQGKHEHHKQIRESRVNEELKHATFIPQIDKNSSKIFKRSQEKNRSKYNSNNVSSYPSQGASSFTDRNYNSVFNINENNNNIKNFQTEASSVGNLSQNKKPNKSLQEPVEYRLLRYGKLKNEKILRQKTKNTIQDSNYSYHPEINEKSQIIASIRRKDRIETAKSFLLSNSKLNDTSNNGYTREKALNQDKDKDEEEDSLLNADEEENNNHIQNENIEDENEEISYDEKAKPNKAKKKFNNYENEYHQKGTRRSKGDSNNYSRSKNINYSSNDSLMNSNNSQEKIRKKIYAADQKKEIVYNNNNNKEIPNTNRTNQSHAGSENTFFNMRLDKKRNHSNTNANASSARNISENKNIVYARGKSPNYINAINNTNNNFNSSKNKSKNKKISQAKNKISKYIPNIKNSDRNVFKPSSSKGRANILDSDSFNKDTLHSKNKGSFTVRSPASRNLSKLNKF